MAKHHPSPNDQRSRSMNPQDAVGKASTDNRSVQLNTDQPQQPSFPPTSDSKGKQSTKNE